MVLILRLSFFFSPDCPGGATCKVTSMTANNGCALPTAFCDPISRTLSPSLINSYPTTFDSATTF